MLDDCGVDVEVRDLCFVAFVVPLVLAGHDLWRLNVAFWHAGAKRGLVTPCCYGTCRSPTLGPWQSPTTPLVESSEPYQDLC